MKSEFIDGLRDYNFPEKLLNDCFDNFEKLYMESFISKQDTYNLAKLFSVFELRSNGLLCKADARKILIDILRDCIEELDFQ